MPFAGGGAPVTAWKRVKVRWKAEMVHEVLIPQELSLDPELLGEYLGVSGEVFDVFKEECVLLETAVIVATEVLEENVERKKTNG